MIKHSHSSYVRRGDALRRRNRIKRVVLLGGFAVAAAFMARERMLQPANAEATHEETGFFSGNEARQLQQELDDTRGKLDLARAELERAKRIMTFSTRYRISADLAASILDVSQAEGIDPELGFRLVKLESDFNERATSPVGALGLTQVMPGTARYFLKGDVTRSRLYDRETNLRVGFRYLRTLVGQYRGDVKLALLVYNRGPVAVEAALKNGVNPTNGYDRIITRGYKGKGTVD
jgi:soluble lytic murein transglycosylase-like protein